MPQHPTVGAIIVNNGAEALSAINNETERYSTIDLRSSMIYINTNIVRRFVVYNNLTYDEEEELRSTVSVNLVHLRNERLHDLDFSNIDAISNDILRRSIRKVMCEHDKLEVLFKWIHRKLRGTPMAGDDLVDWYPLFVGCWDKVDAGSHYTDVRYAQKYIDVMNSRYYNDFEFVDEFGH